MNVLKSRIQAEYTVTEMQNLFKLNFRKINRLVVLYFFEMIWIIVNLVIGKFKWKSISHFKTEAKI